MARIGKGLLRTCEGDVLRIGEGGLLTVLTARASTTIPPMTSSLSKSARCTGRGCSCDAISISAKRGWTDITFPVSPFCKRCSLPTPLLNVSLIRTCAPSASSSFSAGFTTLAGAEGALVEASVGKAPRVSAAEVEVGVKDGEGVV